MKLALRHGCQIIYHATLIDEEAADMLEAKKDEIFVSPTLGVTYTTAYEAGDWGVTTEMAVTKTIVQVVTATGKRLSSKARTVHRVTGRS